VRNWPLHSESSTPLPVLQCIFPRVCRNLCNDCHIATKFIAKAVWQSNHFWGILTTIIILRIAFISEWVRELQKKRTLFLEHIHGIFMFVCVYISLEMLILV
jgi:hypothetical protein